VLIETTISNDLMAKGLLLYYTKVDKTEKNKLKNNLFVGIVLLLVFFIMLFSALKDKEAFWGMFCILMPIFILGYICIYSYISFPKSQIKKILA